MTSLQLVREHSYSSEDLSEIIHLFLAAALTDLDTATINKLLTALNECTEWGQVFILDSLATYQPQDEQEAQNICERVTPRLSHANAAVVLSAVKVLMKFMEMMKGDSQYLTQLIKKLAPPLGEELLEHIACFQVSFSLQLRCSLLSLKFSLLLCETSILLCKKGML